MCKCGALPIPPFTDWTYERSNEFLFWLGNLADVKISSIEFAISLSTSSKWEGTEVLYELFSTLSSEDEIEPITCKRFLPELLSMKERLRNIDGLGAQIISITIPAELQENIAALNFIIDAFQHSKSRRCRLLLTE